MEHLYNIRRGSEASGMAEHIKRDHPEADTGAPEQIVAFRILQQRPKNMERAILESLFIEELERDRSKVACNRKAEWGRQQLRRLTVVGE